MTGVRHRLRQGDERHQGREARRERQLREDRAPEGRLLGRRDRAEQEAQQGEADASTRRTATSRSRVRPDEADQGHRAYAGISGKVNVDLDFVAIGPRLANGKCNMTQSVAPVGPVRERHRLGHGELLQLHRGPRAGSRRAEPRGLSADQASGWRPASRGTGARARTGRARARAAAGGRRGAGRRTRPRAPPRPPRARRA